MVHGQPSTGYYRSAEVGSDSTVIQLLGSADIQLLLYFVYIYIYGHTTRLNIHKYCPFHIITSWKITLGNYFTKC